MIALASVDLPDPFGPIRAWISPRPTLRSTPRRICLSSALTCRLRISSWDIGLRLSVGWSAGSNRLGDGRERQRVALAAARELDELGERRALQRPDRASLRAHPQKPCRARTPAVALVRAEIGRASCREK